MNNTDKEHFDEQWSEFTTMVKGKLIAKAKKQTLSLPLANLILSDAASIWGSEYESCGRWLGNYSSFNPEKGGVIKQILFSDMAFSDLSTPTPIPDYFDYIVPAAGAALGYGAAYLLEGSKLMQVSSLLIPAVALYPAVKTFRNYQKEHIIEISIHQYLEQLNKYRDNILTILL